MPLFEFDCADCGEPFEKLVRTHTPAQEKITCPACGSTQVKKKLSAFAARVSGSGSSSSLSSNASDCSTGGT